MQTGRRGGAGDPHKKLTESGGRQRCILRALRKTNKTLNATHKWTATPNTISRTQDMIRSQSMVSQCLFDSGVCFRTGY